MTAGTIEYPNIQGHFLAMSTGAACLTRIGRIDFDKLPTSFFRFVGQLTKESRPRGVCNAFGQTVVMRHPVHLQVFHADDAIASDDLATMLMGEIVSPESSALMHTGNRLAVLAPLWGSLCQFGVLALHFGQRLLFLAKEARVRNLFTRREHCKGFQPNVYAHLGGILRQAFRFALDGKGSVPLASRGAMNGEGFHLPPDGAVVDHLDRPDLGDHDAAIVCDAEARLREGEAIIAVTPTKTWIAGLLASLDTAEEGLESQINAGKVACC